MRPIRLMVVVYVWFGETYKRVTTNAKKNSMYKSKEIRWFKDSSDKGILDWFAGHGQTFENTAPRTDYYLPLEKEDITVKLREGNIEIKHRVGNPQKGTLTPKCTGFFENWIKWS